MKKPLAVTVSIAVAVLSLVASVGQAGVSCTVSREGVNEPLISLDGAKQHMVLVSRDLKSAREIELKSLDTKEKWEAINGQTLLTMGSSQPGIAGVTAGFIDFREGSENGLPTEAMAIGFVTKSREFVALMLPLKKLSITCSYVN